MPATNKEKILKLRADGMSYGNIAAKLNVSVNTVKTVCRRGLAQNVAAPESQKSDDVCLQCGVTLVHIPHKKQKRFCSDTCRLSWWKLHADNLKKQAIYNFVCQTCGKHFTAYGDKSRKYCSRACFGASRRSAND